MSEIELQPVLRINAEVTRQIRQHARTSMTTEVCGVLIGDLNPNAQTSNQPKLESAQAGSQPATTVFAAISAVNAAQAGTHVTFTQDAWEHIYKVKDADYPNDRIVGWYHSHPGFGVFLSEHDTFIQENFFSAPNQVAWVFDPHTDEEGCFGWVDGQITRLTAITLADTDTPANISETRELTSSSDPEDVAEDPPPSAPSPRPASSRWLRWTATAAGLFAALVLGFSVSHILFPALYPLVLPMNSVTGQPMIRDPKTGEAVYMDPQTKKFIILDSHSGKLTSVDPNSLRALQSPADPSPQPPPAPIAPTPSQAAAPPAPSSNTAPPAATPPTTAFKEKK